MLVRSNTTTAAITECADVFPPVCFLHLSCTDQLSRACIVVFLLLVCFWKSNVFQNTSRWLMLGVDKIGVRLMCWRLNLQYWWQIFIAWSVFLRLSPPPYGIPMEIFSLWNKSEDFHNPKDHIVLRSASAFTFACVHVCAEDQTCI